MNQFSICEGRFNLKDRVAVITGGAGLLGKQHGAAIASAGGTVVLVDISADRVAAAALEHAKTFPTPVWGVELDITDQQAVCSFKDKLIERFGRVDILINNAANNPKVEDDTGAKFTRLENFPLAQWHADVSVGLTGAFLCSQVLGAEMSRKRRGVILNIASHFALIAPDQRLYRKPGLPDDRQPVKPVTYSVVKAGLIGLTRYFATYWADAGVRVNSLSPGGVFNGQPNDFVEKFSERVPLGRMANPDEYQGAVLFLCSDASSYMTGANLVVDGGRTSW